MVGEGRSLILSVLRRLFGRTVIAHKRRFLPNDLYHFSPSRELIPLSSFRMIPSSLLIDILEAVRLVHLRVHPHAPSKGCHFMTLARLEGEGKQRICGRSAALSAVRWAFDSSVSCCRRLRPETEAKSCKEARRSCIFILKTIRNLPCR